MKLAVFGLTMVACGGSLAMESEPSVQPAESASGDLQMLPVGPSLCLPELERDEAGLVPCRVLLALADPADACRLHPGMRPLDRATAQAFRAANGIDAVHPCCEVGQLAASCRTAAEPGWCYVDHAAGSECSHSLRFSAVVEPPSGAFVSFACP